MKKRLPLWMLGLLMAACDTHVDPPPAPLQKPTGETTTAAAPTTGSSSAGKTTPGPPVPDPNPGVPVDATAETQRSIPELIAALQHDDERVRLSAELALAATGPAVVPEVAKQLKDLRARHHALSVLRRLGPNVLEGMPALIAAIEVSDFGVSVLGVIAKLGRPAVPALLEAIPKADERRKCHIAQALGALGADAKEAIPALQKLMEEPDRGVATNAGRALDTIRQRTTPVLTLAAGLGSADTAVRRQSARDLAALGPNAAEAIPNLIEAFRQTPNDSGIDEALRQVGNGAYLPLLGLLRSDNVALATRALNLLYVTAKPPREAMPELRAMVRGSSVRLQSWGLKLLGQFGPDGAVAIPDAAPLLQSPDDQLKQGAINFLAATKSPDAAPLLAKLLQSPARNDQLQALGALQRLGAAAAVAEPQVRKLLQDREEVFRTFAGRILRNIEASKK